MSQAATALSHQQRMIEQQQGTRLAFGPPFGEQAHAQAAHYLPVAMVPASIGAAGIPVPVALVPASMFGGPAARSN